MARNLKGLSKSIANKKSNLKAKGVSVDKLNDIVPNGYSKLTIGEQKRILNKLNKLSQPKTKTKKENKLTPSKFIKELKKARKNYINTIPKEYKKSSVFMNYFTEGHGLKKSDNDIRGYGLTINNANSVKELENYYHTKDKQLILKLMQEDINYINSLNFNDRLDNLKEKIYNEIEVLNEVENDGLNTHNLDNYKSLIDDMPYHQLKTLYSFLDNMGNVYDSIFNNNKVGGGQGEFQITLRKLIQLSQKDKIEDYQN